MKKTLPPAPSLKVIRSRHGDYLATVRVHSCGKASVSTAGEFFLVDQEGAVTMCRAIFEAVGLEWPATNARGGDVEEEPHGRS